MEMMRRMREITPDTIVGWKEEPLLARLVKGSSCSTPETAQPHTRSEGLKLTLVYNNHPINLGGMQYKASNQVQFKVQIIL